ncbi:hypothetical protein D3C85_1434490 [compost metagenome]
MVFHRKTIQESNYWTQKLILTNGGDDWYRLHGIIVQVNARNKALAQRTKEHDIITAHDLKHPSPLGYNIRHLTDGKHANQCVIVDTIM